MSEPGLYTILLIYTTVFFRYALLSIIRITGIIV